MIPMFIIKISMVVHM